MRPTLPLILGVLLFCPLLMGATPISDPGSAPAVPEAAVTAPAQSPETDAQRPADRDATIADLREQLHAAQQRIAALEKQAMENAVLRENRSQSLQLRWWLQGAALILAGMIAALILIYLPRPGKFGRRQ